MNVLCIGGNLGSDPDFRITAGGHELIRFSVAVNERVKKKGEWVNHTEWFRVTLWGGRAKGLSKCLAMGDRVAVTGRQRTSSYESPDGETRWSVELVADSVTLMGSGKGKGRIDGESSKDVSESCDDDDIPFLEHGYGTKKGPEL